MSTGGHVLVIGVDGVRFDYLGPAATPAIWALGQAGFLTAVPVDETTPTWSGPCWATIATGTGVAGHGITGNDLTGHRLAGHPDFVTRATRAGLPTLLAVSGWPPLALAEDGGPLFAEATRREFVPVPEGGLAWDAGQAGAAELAAGDAADQETAERAGAILAADGDAGPPRVSFVYLGAVDFAGHATGTGDAYRSALRAADQRVGRLLGAVSSSSREPWTVAVVTSSSREPWTVAVVTDHGHLDEGGHGGREPEVTTAWAAAAGPGIAPGGRPPLITRQDQVAPLVLRAAGLAGARTA
ncbi:MAG TPA: alkaline phosphatase family protein [Streptosporangiaceae bacterium]|nr:alkaline phosphatase family protein [Streptosporangiaceae bacterium]